MPSWESKTMTHTLCPPKRAMENSDDSEGGTVDGGLWTVHISVTCIER